MKGRLVTHYLCYVLCIAYLFALALEDKCIKTRIVLARQSIMRYAFSLLCINKVKNIQPIWTSLHNIMLLVAKGILLLRSYVPKAPEDDVIMSLTWFYLSLQCSIQNWP